MTELLQGYTRALLGEYAKAPAKNWVHKDAAMYIVLALSVQGTDYIRVLSRSFAHWHCLVSLRSPNSAHGCHSHEPAHQHHGVFQDSGPPRAAGMTSSFIQKRP